MSDAPDSSHVPQVGHMWFTLFAFPLCLQCVCVCVSQVDQRRVHAEQVAGFSVQTTC